ncbi:hypothetical protein CYLTODRAFT_493410 [Cylindrobasidium torrendii FP15055 ss-10]|uniref:F-box domain-containing protein n=1 Tax=Cylindrobasidium torrendii FP15055 ss-10 TaxID=1314674 RepID=A0A0D7B0B6_9AGAR|nr:hypothetical protein CYLTODRAFT_493410 [Cylindrobasidium torrendii FP15055 ss-10]
MSNIAGLPYELVMEIFEWSHLADRQSMLVHCLVCQSARRWIQKEFYRVLVFTCGTQARLFLRTLQTSPALSRIPNILIFRPGPFPGNKDNEDIVTQEASFHSVMENCASVHTLSWMISPMKNQPPPMPNLRRLYLWQMQDLAECSIPPTVTHLALMSPYLSLRFSVLFLDRILGDSSITHVAVCVDRGSESHGVRLCGRLTHRGLPLDQLSVALVNADRNLEATKTIVRAARSDPRIVPFLIDWTHRREDPAVPVDSSMDVEYERNSVTTLFGFDVPPPGFTDVWVRAERIRARGLASSSYPALTVK